MREDVRSEVGDIPAIQGLRGIAVLWVIGFHYVVLREQASDAWVAALHRVPPLEALLRDGYLGVDLFFLISGFLLALPWLVHAREGIAPPSAGRFYERRIRRIVPAYYMQLFLLFTVALPLLQGPAYWRSDLYVDLWNGIAHGLFLQDTSPLTSGSLNVNGALWTLPIEVQFYAVLPLLAPVFVRAPRLALAVAIAIAFGWQWLAAHDLRFLVDGELALGAHWHWSEKSVRMVLGMQLPAYLGHFGLGIALGRLWLAHRARPATTRWRANRLLVVGAAAALLVGSMSGVIRLPDEHVRMVPTLALGLLLFVAVTSRNAPVRAALGAGPLAFVGKVSYSAYLCHLPVIAIWGMHPSVFPGWLSLPGYLAFVLAVSWMSWRWIEQPYLRPRTRRAGKRAFVELPLSGEEPAPSPASESRR